MEIKYQKHNITSYKKGKKELKNNPLKPDDYIQQLHN